MIRKPTPTVSHVFSGPDVWSFYRCIYNDWLGKAHVYSYPQNVSCVGCN